MVAYHVSFELLARMSGTSPFIPYEMGKYLFFFLTVIGIAKYKIKKMSAVWMVFCLIPGLLIDKSGMVNRQDLIFNFMGPLNVALAVMLFSSKSMSKTLFKKIIGILILPLIAVLCHSFFKAPDLSDVEFGLGANIATSGGFGSNQVSTGLGLASFLLYIFWINRWKFSGSRIVDTLMLVIFILQGLLTFSRGGMVTGFVGIIILTILLKKVSEYQIRRFQLPRIGNYLLPAISLVAGVFFLVNSLTGGMLFLRYQGETTGTMAGNKQKDLNVITSGRLDILMGDMDLWLENPLVGVGVGASKYLREKMGGVVAHIEFSRLLADQGILGLTYFGILIYLGFKLPRSNPDPSVVAIVCALFAIGVFTSFHAAMRTFVSPLTIGLSMVLVRVSAVNKKSLKKAEINQTLIKL